MRKKITKIEKDLKALNKWLVGDKKKAKKKQLKKLLKKSKEKNKFKDFNVFSYSHGFFVDTCIFNSGSIIFTDSEDISNVIKTKIEEYAVSLDIFKDDTIYKPYSPSSKFITTQYNIIWKQINPGTRRKLICHRYKEEYKIDTYNNFSHDKFIWNLSNIKYMVNVKNNPIYAFRSLSTIIVDTQDIIKYNENMEFFTKGYSIDINYPLYRQLNLFNKKVLSFNINIDSIFGICPEFTLDFFNYCRFDHFYITYKPIYFTDYTNLRLMPTQKPDIPPKDILTLSRSERYNLSKKLTELLKKFIRLDNNTSKIDIAKQSKPMNKKKYRYIKSPYDTCYNCTQPLYDDIYIIENNMIK